MADYSVLKITPTDVWNFADFFDRPDIRDHKNICQAIAGKSAKYLRDYLYDHISDNSIPCLSDRIDECIGYAIEDYDKGEL